MSEYSAPEEVDQAVEASRVSRVLQFASQIGGTALAGIIGYKAGAGDVDVLPITVAVGGGAGLALTSFGSRLGIERGAAARRNFDREAIGTAPGVFDEEKRNDSILGIRGAAALGAPAASLTALMSGLMEGAKSVGYENPALVHPKILLALAGVLAVASAATTAQAGRNFDSQPVLHAGLQIV